MPLVHPGNAVPTHDTVRWDMVSMQNAKVLLTIIPIDSMVENTWVQGINSLL